MAPFLLVVPVKKLFVFIFILNFSFSCLAGELLVSAAASMSDVMLSIGKLYQQKNPGTKINFNFGPSGQFKTQIEKGAPVDIFVTAKESHIDDLIKGNLVAPEKKAIVAYNTLVAISPSIDEKSGKHATFLRALSSKVNYKLAVGTPKIVPAGDYAFDMFNAFSIQDEVKDHLVYGNSVRQVLDYAVRGEVDFAIVYLTDAIKRGKSVTIIEKFPSFSHSSIIYAAAIVKASKNQSEAQAFLTFIGSVDSHKILESNGFRIKQ